uniref:Uncharacterized protein n=1 Tax=Halalkalibacterium halodurans TaxID=86665 RepID=A0A0M0KGF6_ALKHA
MTFAAKERPMDQRLKRELKKETANPIVRTRHLIYMYLSKPIRVFSRIVFPIPEYVPLCENDKL